MKCCPRRRKETKKPEDRSVNASAIAVTDTILVTGVSPTLGGDTETRDLDGPISDTAYQYKPFPRVLYLHYDEHSSSSISLQERPASDCRTNSCDSMRNVMHRRRKRRHRPKEGESIVMHGANGARVSFDEIVQINDLTFKEVDSTKIARGSTERPLSVQSTGHDNSSKGAGCAGKKLFADPLTPTSSTHDHF